MIAECNATVAAINQLRKFCQARTQFEASKVTLAAGVEALKARGCESGCVVLEPDLMQKDMSTVPAPRKSSAQASSSIATATTIPDVSNNLATVSDDNKSAGADDSVEIVPVDLPDIEDSLLKVNEDDDNSEVEEEDFVLVPETEVSAPYNT